MADGTTRKREAPPIPLTRQQAQALQAERPRSRLGRWLRGAGLAGLAVAVLCAVFGGRGGLFWSALYGAASVIGALGAVGARDVKASGRGPAAAAVGFMVWEGVKVVLSVAMLVAAARVVPDLSWPALLVALTVCLEHELGGSAVAGPPREAGVTEENMAAEANAAQHAAPSAGDYIVHHASPGKPRSLVDLASRRWDRCWIPSRSA